MAVTAACVAIAAPAIASPGDLDPSFGRFGKATFDPAGALVTGDDVAIAASGRVIVAGTYSSRNADWRGGVFGFRRDGSQDPGFGDGGITVLGGSAFPGAAAVALQPDGRILVASPRLLFRLLPDGRVDPSFGGDGAVPTNLVGDLELTVDSLGRIVVAGDRKLARFNPDGSVDSSFGGSGEIATPFASEFAGIGLAISSDGRMVLGGEAPEPSRAGLVARYLNDGVLDPGFGAGGAVTESFNGRDGRITDVAVQPDGAVVATASVSGTGRVLRYRPDGSRDPSFAGDGLSGALIDPALTLELQPDHKVVVGGAAAGKPSFFVARLRSNGRLDPSFSRNGWLRTALGDETVVLNALALQPGGRIVAVGTEQFFDIRSTELSVVLARYLDGGRRHDADADGRADAADRCRQVAARRHHGCPIYARAIGDLYYGYGTDSLNGYLTSANQRCTETVPISLFAKRPGRDRLVRRTRSDGDGFFSFGLASPYARRYYVVAPRIRKHDLGVCERASGAFQRTAR